MKERTKRSFVNFIPKNIYSNVDKFISLIKDSYKEMSKRNINYRIFFHRDNYI